MGPAAFSAAWGRGDEPGAPRRVALDDGGEEPKLTSTAIYEGAFEPGTDADGCFAAVREKLEPVWRGFPEVLAVRVHRVRELDPGAIPVVMVEDGFGQQSPQTRRSQRRGERQMLDVNGTAILG